MPGLTPKEERFVEEYLVDLNGTAAAIRAGYSARSARAIAHENLTKPHIQDAIATAKAERSARTRVTQDLVIEELRRLAFANVRNFLARAAKADGGGLVVRSLEDVPPDMWPAVVEVRQDKDGSVRLKLGGKMEALKLLYEHAGKAEETERGDDFDAALDELDAAVDGP